MTVIYLAAPHNTNAGKTVAITALQESPNKSQPRPRARGSVARVYKDNAPTVVRHKHILSITAYDPRFDQENLMALDF
jgi:hypothetical protein